MNARLVSFIALLMLTIGVAPSPAVAQFSSGSTGVQGQFPPATANSAAGTAPTGTSNVGLDLRNGVVNFTNASAVSTGTATLLNVPAGGFADGVLHFTTFVVPQNVTLSFIRNDGNTPVTILVSGDVTVAGTIALNGQGGESQRPGGGRGGLGGPGGFKGGNGENLQTSVGGAGDGLGPGAGKGGGRVTFNSAGGGAGFGFGGGNDSANHAVAGGTYGTPALLPIVGGSGGGGGCSASTGGSANGGGGGGGGGGAILIASSGTITIASTGQIQANGGGGGNQGGAGGSGGAIRLVANTLAGSGVLSTAGGGGGGGNSLCFNAGGGGNGRVRLEAFFNTFNMAGVTGNATSSGPGPVFLANPPSIRIVSVGGRPVPSIPLGTFGAVDVALDSPGTYQVVIATSRVPVASGICVSAKAETDSAVPVSTSPCPAVSGTFESGTATATLNLDAGGNYFIEARATFTVP